jgi:lipopolysaccharide cholinephosphotransferase
MGLLLMAHPLRAYEKEVLTSSIFPRTDPKLVGLIYQMLKVIDLLFTKHGIFYWIHGGTALGAVRHQGMIPWDDDADLIFLMRDERRIFALADEFAKYGFYLKKDKIFRLYPSVEKRYPYIDIAGYSLTSGNTLRFHCKVSRKLFPNFYWLPEEIASLKRVKFGPIELNAPNEMMRYLITGYGADCMSRATFQTPHAPGKDKVIIREKVIIDDFSPAEYEIENPNIPL